MPPRKAANLGATLLASALERIALASGAQVALVGEFLAQPVPRIRTLYCLADGKATPNFSFPLQDDPAEHLPSKGSKTLGKDVRDLYPKCLLLQDFEANAYAARTFSLDGLGGGIVCLYWRSTPGDLKRIETLLAEFSLLFVKQAGTLQHDIERVRAEHDSFVHAEFFREYVLDNPGGVSFSEFIPPVPVNLPEEVVIERIMHTGMVVECNRAIARMYGYESTETMMGATPFDVNGPEKAPRNIGYWVRTGFNIRDVESQAVDANGEVTWISGTVVGKIVDGKLLHFWTKRADITDRKRYEAAIHHKAHHDPLTGLPNRYWFQERIGTLAADHKPRGKQFCMALLDLNGFKEINDTLGHVVGDQILRAVSVRLLKGLKPHGAEMARLGGDEFAILMPEVGDPEDAEAMAQTLQQLLTQYFLVEDMQLSIGGSLGLVLYPAWSDDAEDLLRMADVAMYAAKKEGLPFRWYQPELDHHSRRRLSLLSSLRPAIDNGELFLAYQPKIDIWDGSHHGFEALVRWQHPTHGLIPPNDFIPFAETNEVIRPLTRWVLAEAIAQGARWRAAGRSMTMAVNISVRNLHDEELAPYIAHCLAEHDFPAELLELEVTESALMTRPAQAMSNLQELRALGLAIAIDDFGTGYSSLAYLARLPVTTLKVDQAFVKGMAHSKADEQIVRAIIGLAHQCQLTVVAEGVEDTDTLRALLNMGCDLAQGFVIARPLDAQAADAWMSSRAAGTTADDASHVDGGYIARLQ
ncbi:MAG TPA: EAL domain-containing protein [Rhodocyclaceae bacterium]|nr:EAL domain-containing protein [Rhodocyclaceae bacterium]